MHDQSNNTHDAFMEVLREKVESQDKKINTLEENISRFPDYSKQLIQITNSVEEIKTNVKNNNFPIEEMRELSQNIANSLRLLKQPVENKILHHHHIPKIIFITCGLLIITGILSAGWYMSVKNLEQYKENDTKYRYLKLYENKSLIQLLNITDSLYNVNPGMRDSVILQEEKVRKKLEMLEQAEEMEKKARELKEKVNKK